MHSSLRLSQAAATARRVRLVALNDVYELKNLPKLQTFLSSMDAPPDAVILPGNFLKSSPLTSLDQGRGVVSTMVACGITHVCWGNHEAHFDLAILRDRIREFGSSITLLNSNLRSLDLKQENEYTRIHTLRQNWNEILEMTPPHATIAAAAEGDADDPTVNVALMGLLSDEPTMFRDRLFRGVVPIENCLDAFEWNYQDLFAVPDPEPEPTSNPLLERLIQEKQKELGLTGTNNHSTSTAKQAKKEPKNNKVDFIIPITHQSTQRDRELARHMLQTDNEGIYKGGGLIIGGDHHDDDATILEEVVDGNRTIQIIKAGNQAKQAAWIDLEFEVSSREEPAKLRNITTQFIELESSFQDSFVIKAILDKQMQVVKNLENEVLVDNSNNDDDSLVLSSLSAQYEQTTVGALVCNAIQEELQADAAILHSGALYADTIYPSNTMTYAQLKQELEGAEEEPTTKIVVVPMTRLELFKAITFARMNLREEPNGFLQTDSELSLQYPSSEDETIQVAVPHNLLLPEEGDNCKILPLMQLGKTLQHDRRLSAREDGTAVLDLVTRNCCKNRWMQIMDNQKNDATPTFDCIDLNRDGVLDKDEITLLLTKVMGYKPQDYVIDDMIQSIDQDGNGVIDEDEFNALLARLERHKNQKGVKEGCV